jgi:hypothetical protein
MFTAAFAVLAFGPADAPRPEPKAKPLAEQVAAYLTTEQCPEVTRAVEGWSRLPKADRASLMGLLVPALTDVRRIGLLDTADLIIQYRIDRGDLKFYGHGWIVSQDLFTTGGRAAWAVSRLLDTDLPELNAGLTADEWAKRAAEIARRVERFRTDTRTDSKAK